ncbi:MAG: endonuclease/exonuclease/phosphatase family protein [Ruminococcus sp.]|nr:endonuclease/exonuclease/phosphatase family protein [Ruminococcus sp.]
MKKEKIKKRHRVLRVILTVFIMILLTVIVYVAYVFLSYSRIEDNQKLNVEGKAASDAVQVEKTYTALTYNIGFGAYTPDFTFFMDGGKQSWADSYESVKNCVNGVSQTAIKHNSDFIFYQEVDTDSTRSHHLNEVEQIKNSLAGYSSVYAQNYHSAFLMYPITQPHGASNSGLLTVSNTTINSAVRRSLPIATDFSKIIDLDRCYSVSRLKTSNGKELVAYNIHASAYINDPKILENQFKMLFNDMESEYKKGNYIICGGDFNHDFTGDSVRKLNPNTKEEFAWCTPFPDEMLPKGIKKNTDYSDKKVTPTTRNADIPYTKGKSFTVIIDGFLTSDNIDVSYVENVDTGFLYSDHNPVVMKFELKK